MLDNIIVNCDTDSIMITKPDQSPWTKEEQSKFLDALNQQFPEMINWANDGVFTAVLVAGSKNYALLPENKPTIKIKGSAFKDQKKEPAMREMMKKIINAFLYDRQNEITGIYHKYVKEASNIQDISRWCQKKSITEPVLKCKGYEKYTKEQLKVKEIRANETNVWDAVKNEELVQLGDKVYTYPCILSSSIETTTTKTGKVKEKQILTYGLKMSKYWDGKDQDVEHLYKRLFDTISIFDTVLDMEQIKNYSLVKNKELLTGLE